ncbi:MAG: hypothetical protein AB4206_11080 [Xenococcaceae cyanobacterium]
MTFSYQDSQTELLGENFPFAPNEDTRGEATISAIRFFQEFVQRNPTDLLAVRSQFSLGLDALDARIDWGIPLVNIDSDPDTLQENGIHFSINYRL